mmetsp:Transcript_2706/g.5834  ORF Transcript_2706/g.5834 Transcript_2706/m.5834 type:complete len:93 (-) Transcript_2706:839-1117(-)
MCVLPSQDLPLSRGLYWMCAVTAMTMDTSGCCWLRCLKLVPVPFAFHSLMTPQNGPQKRKMKRITLQRKMFFLLLLLALSRKLALQRRLRRT